MDNVYITPENVLFILGLNNEEYAHLLHYWALACSHKALMLGDSIPKADVHMLGYRFILHNNPQPCFDPSNQKGTLAKDGFSESGKCIGRL